MSFYQKYRPQKFAHLVNQNHVKKTLISALKRGRVAHAYLFAGPRGTGKTSTARLLAKAVNCQKGKIEPCNKCLSCQEHTSLKSLDLIEIDAASNRGIDEIRELREKIQFAPAASTYKVFIIDEVHMLTPEAFNALLKTLEEPPAHAIFILATTGPHKVPPTILSRCQRFDFLPLSIVDIVKELERIAKKEKLKCDKEALQIIAISSSGSLRDAVSILDQMSVTREKIRKEKVQEILGIVPERAIIKLFGFIKEGESEEALKVIQRIEERGYNMTNFKNVFLFFLQKILIYKASADEKILEGYSRENLKKIKELAKSVTFGRLLKIIKKISKYTSLDKEQFPSLGFEVAVLELRDRQKSTEMIKKESRVNKKSIGKKEWEEVVKKIKLHNYSLSAILDSAKIVEIKGQELCLGVRFSFHQERISDFKNRKTIEEAIEEVLGEKYFIKCQITKRRDKKSLKDMAMEVFGS